MNRLPIALSAVALVVAIVAAAVAFRGTDRPQPGLDQAAVEAMIAKEIEARATEPADGGALDPEKVGPVVRDYLIANPGILEDVLTALEDKRQRDQVVAQSEALEQNRETIFRSATSPVVGNPAGKVTLVEFFDYNCGYCKRMLPAMLDLMKTDPELRVVMKEWPVLTEGSAEAARVALAVQKVAPDRYLDFHAELMALPGGGEGINKARALKSAEKLGLDRTAIEEALKDPAIEAAISENFRVAEALGLRGTPSYVVGNEIIPGAVSFEALQEKIAEARKSDCQTC